MKNTPQYYLDKITSAAKSLDQGKLAKLCSQLIEDLPTDNESFPSFEAKMILQILRQKKFFNLMMNVADGFLSDAQTDAQIIRQYGQALIDTGKLTGASLFLTGLLDDPDLKPKEKDEALGLMGRISKQLYVNRKNATLEKKSSMMQKALEKYLEAFNNDRDKNLWHGINVVALLLRAERDGLDIKTEEDARKIASSLIQSVSEAEVSGFVSMWDYATALEAAIALRENRLAISWTDKYLKQGKQKPDAFELTSTIRQLDEIWEINSDSEVGGEVFSLLNAALLDAEEGRLSLSKEKYEDLKNNLDKHGSDQERYEKVFGEDSYRRIGWLRLGLECAQSTGLVCKLTGRGVGSGFLVKGGTLSERLEKDGWYFLTNSHVITNDESVLRGSLAGRKPLRPEEAYISFELLFDMSNPKHEIAELIWTSPPSELDATLLRLNTVPAEDKLKKYIISEDLPVKLPKAKSNPRLYIIGHPHGGNLSVSLQDNHLLEQNDSLVQYRTPTDPGSSGSPIFNEDWQLVGIHHAGSQQMQSLEDSDEFHEANEGIRISAIIKQLNADLA